MNDDPFLRQLANFYRAARHLWGRCPLCHGLFRLSDAAICYGSEPPRDWLRRAQKQQDRLLIEQDRLGQQEADLEQPQRDLMQREDELYRREREVERIVRDRVREVLKGKDEVRGLLKAARQEAVQRSRSTLLGHFFERLAPFLQRFNHDPRDIRPLMNPVDYVCFDGLTVNRLVERVTFVEVKAGASKPSSVQRSIAEAVRLGNVETEVWQCGDVGIPITRQLLSSAPRNGLQPRNSA